MYLIKYGFLSARTESPNSRRSMSFSDGLSGSLFAWKSYHALGIGLHTMPLALSIAFCWSLIIPFVSKGNRAHHHPLRVRGAWGYGVSPCLIDLILSERGFVLLVAPSRMLPLQLGTGLPCVVIFRLHMPKYAH